MKILNLYAGIGGNRKLWGDDHEITAIEIDQNIANIYHEFYPKDTILVCDAHDFLLKNIHSDYDFIWASPPCPTHSDIKRCAMHRGIHKIVYPDMTLYQEIILLRYFSRSMYCVENVKPYYDLLIPGQIRQRHVFWANFYVPEFNDQNYTILDSVKNQCTAKDIDIKKLKCVDKRKVIRNCVQPELGLHIFEAMQRQFTENKK